MMRAEPAVTAEATGTRAVAGSDDVRPTGADALERTREPRA
ncbi:hypothetical protein [Actinacidiphila acididurans]|nr:hypothetical protein [Actinacidiphila acididurans]